VIESVTVVLSADNKYAMPLTVAARSVISSFEVGRPLAICVLDMGIDGENRAKLERSLRAPNVRILWVDSLRERVAHLPNTWAQITRATYARLYIPEVLPSSTRALYLDCDVIARRSVGELFDLDMNGRAALAVPDMQSPFVSSPYAVPLWFEAGRAASEPNFNAGVMLMDLIAWRERGVCEATLRYLTDGRHHFAQDQEAINVILAGNIGLLDPRWNQQSEFYLKQYEVLLPYTRAEREEIRENPFITHYSNAKKPWHYGYEHPRLHEWFAALDQTAWAGWRPRQTVKERAIEVLQQCREIARHGKRSLRAGFRPAEG
jgi:lipopolysaccharide biosynthesis glycosyltransferase